MNILFYTIFFLFIFSSPVKAIDELAFTIENRFYHLKTAPKNIIFSTRYNSFSLIKKPCNGRTFKNLKNNTINIIKLGELRSNGKTHIILDCKSSTYQKHVCNLLEKYPSKIKQALLESAIKCK